MWYKQIIGNELYVYFNGSLVYKRWLKEGYGRIFEKNGYSWIPKNRD